MQTKKQSLKHKSPFFFPVCVVLNLSFSWWGFFFLVRGVWLCRPISEATGRKMKRRPISPSSLSPPAISGFSTAFPFFPTKGKLWEPPHWGRHWPLQSRSAGFDPVCYIINNLRVGSDNSVKQAEKSWEEYSVFTVNSPSVPALHIRFDPFSSPLIHQNSNTETYSSPDNLQC